MLAIYNALRSVYASSEITMEDLHVLQKYDFIRFENRGISRSNRDCLLCEVYCEPFATFLQKADNAIFDSPEALRKFIKESGIGLVEALCTDGEIFIFLSEDKEIEVSAVLENGKISIDEIEVLPYFQVFLRVQR
jgi:hypothetical protein